MKMKLRGVGDLPDLSINLDGLTIVLGEDSVGKSTILKSAYSVAECPVDFRSKKDDSIRTALQRILDTFMAKSSADEGGAHLMQELLDDRDYPKVIEAVKSHGFDNVNDRNEAMGLIEVVEGLVSGEEDASFMASLLKRNLSNEFNDIRQVRDLRSDRDASIRFIDGDGEVGGDVDGSNNVEWRGRAASIFASAVYYDTPFIMDERCHTNGRNHRHDICDKVQPRELGIIDEMSFRKNIERFDAIVNTVVDGEFVKSRAGCEYVTGDGIHISPSNLAAGMKVFGILKQLVHNGFIKNNSLVLLDEPEAHLHPTWQNTLAKLIVLLAKDMGVKVLMTTHSPQLLLAVQAASEEYAQAISCYMLTRDGGNVSFIDLQGDLSPVYSVMADAYEEADRMYWDAMDRRGPAE